MVRLISGAILLGWLALSSFTTAGLNARTTTEIITQQVKELELDPQQIEPKMKKPEEGAKQDFDTSALLRQTNRNKISVRLRQNIKQPAELYNPVPVSAELPEAVNSLEQGASEGIPGPTFNCWNQCGQQSGTCAACDGGKCCRQHFGGGDCLLSEGGPDFHACVAKGLPNPAFDCYDSCGRQSGTCVACGGGKCCRQGFGGGDCLANEGGATFHTCVSGGCLCPNGVASQAACISWNEMNCASCEKWSFLVGTANTVGSYCKACGTIGDGGNPCCPPPAMPCKMSSWYCGKDGTCHSTNNIK
eukprot:gb/GEZN01012615.1/.p1 GENE.gb/GEZN01012615.1/~~gb/GEZN01012615.1/.p1  ORF type:complete len:303 (-),score=9.59 gb/GEZN01012615.1/:98-1006(-)